MKKTILCMVVVVLASQLAACSSEPSLSELEEWDLVWISDSSGWGVANIYAAMVEEDTGKKINLHDQWQGGLSAGSVLSALQGTPTADMGLRQTADLIREAEIVVFYGNPEDSEYDGTDWVCTSNLEPNYVNSCSMESFDPYIADLEAVYEMIFELRKDKPTIVRAFDAYNPLINLFKQQGVFEECKECWGNYNMAIHQAAEAYNVPVAAVALAWNGADFSQDPSDLGFVKDGIHPNEEGAWVIAQAIRETGYEPVER